MRHGGWEGKGQGARVGGWRWFERGGSGEVLRTCRQRKKDGVRRGEDEMGEGVGSGKGKQGERGGGGAGGWRVERWHRSVREGEKEV